MAGYYNKDELKEKLEIEQIYDLLIELGGEPEYSAFGLICNTICHNHPKDDGSRKLYYYENSQLFKCYTQCDSSFDVFELVCKSMKIQKNLDWELYDAMCYIADFFGFAESEKPNEQYKMLEDWNILKKYSNLKQQTFSSYKKENRSFNPIILTKFEYPRIWDWEQEGISYEVCKQNFIGYYPGKEQITIPHFDINNNLIGIRGRSLISLDAERYGKYKPLIINDIQYNHPLSVNLYHLNKSQNNIRKTRTAIIFESEKSVLQYETMYGQENNISVACCGSSVSNYQINLLEALGVKEIIIGFDRQFQAIGDNEFQKLKNKILNIEKKYSKKIKISAIFDKEMITPYKSSPTDQGREIFEYLLEKRIKDFN